MSKHLGLESHVIQKSVGHLEVLVSNAILVSMKAQNFHWHVTGPHFAEYHELFQKHYEDLGGVIDQLAERIRALDHKAPKTLQQVLNHATLIESNSSLEALDMIKILRDDYHNIVLDMHQAVHDLDDADIATRMMLEDLLGDMEKKVWLLGAHLSSPV